MRHRSSLVLTASAAALLAAGAQASAHNAAAVLECTTATITADRFAGGSNPATAVVTVDGVAPDHTRAPYEAARAVVVCPSPAPVPGPVITPTPGPSPGPVTETPKTATTPGPTSRPPVKRPARPRYLCPAPLPSKAWQRIILRRHGVRCPLRRPAPPVHIAVTGERVPAAVSLAKWVAQVIPAATGDQPSAWRPVVEGNATTAHLVAAYVRSAPPAPPRPVAGLTGWRCTGTRTLTCSSSRATLQLVAAVRYRATAVRSILVVDVGPRPGGAR